MSEFTGGAAGLEARLKTSVETVNGALDSLLSDGKQLLQRDGARTFADKHVNRFGACIKLYHSLFTACGVLTRREFLDTAKRLYKYDDIREAMDELLENEDRYDEFLAEVDKQLRKDVQAESAAMVAVGTDVPADCHLLDLTQCMHSGIGLGDCRVSLEDVSSASDGRFTLLVMLRHLS
eukprot:scpid80994/ scgid32571/ 